MYAITYLINDKKNNRKIKGIAGVSKTSKKARIKFNEFKGIYRETKFAIVNKSYKELLKMNEGGELQYV